MSLQRSGLLPDTQRVNPVSEIHREAQEGNFPDRQTDRHLRPLPPLSTDVCLGVVRAFTGAPVCGEREPKARGETRLGRPGAAVGEGTGWVGLQVESLGISPVVWVTQCLQLSSASSRRRSGSGVWLCSRCCDASAKFVV